MRFSNIPSVALRSLIPAALILLMAFPAGTFAQTAPADHLISSQNLQQQMLDSASSRKRNIETITNFLSTPEAEQAMRDAHFNAVQVKTAIPTLSDQELASLAARSADAQQKFAAGNLTKPELALIVIALVVLVVVILVH
jgi:phosphatidylserine/phosphatidylglycerophosphate/cardiolipin synthase-like enzyme